ncbi:hypothetical protein HZS55_02975 [Halosimplex rubrum]|uniref:SF3 helicase domain-containing protein n=1 Tax=Halosimplex rubrum TaxID=869889 RepID=A0A7D5SP60_9EURY|nr:phage/plasmid primase, P4 family [Halosimplex rubrum]QLH76327.1 hypothetical protein HZS55_02975 [Halosimplex rubrum]
MEAAQKHSADKDEVETFERDLRWIYTNGLDLNRGERVPFDQLRAALVEEGFSEIPYQTLLMKAVLDGWVKSTDESDPRNCEIWLEPRGPERSWQQVVAQEEPTRANERASYALEELSNELQIVALRDTGELYACHSGVWHNDSEQVLRERLSDYMDRSYSKSVLSAAEVNIRANWAIPRQRFGVPAGTLPLQNGLFELRNRELKPIQPDDYITEQLPISYDSEAECPEFQSLLDTVVPEAEKQQKLQEFAGYCLLPQVPYKKGLMLLGETSTGKSTFLRAIEQLFRDQDIASVSPEKLQLSKHTAANLEHKTVNIVDELDGHHLNRTDKIKKAISGDPMAAEPKYEQEYRFTPTCKHIFASNKSLKASITEDAFWSRWVTVVFEEQIPKDNRVSQDQIISQFEDEAAGILNWALDGLDRLRAQDSFTDSRSPSETHQLWTGFGDVVSEFIDVAIANQSGSTVFTDDLHSHYEEFCARTGREVAREQHQLTAELKERGIAEYTREWDPRKGNSAGCFTGIMLRDLDSKEVVQDLGI